MNRHGHASQLLALGLVLVLALMTSGCGNIFVAKYKVLVDSITAPGTAKPSGRSYRLIAKKSVVTQTQVQVAVVKACVDAALEGIGMFEAPSNVAPDLFIEVAYGVDTAGRSDPSTRETFVQLAARENPGRSVDKATGEEVWDVRVAVLGIAGRVETAMPLLCAVAAGYIGSDTKMETKVELPQNDPRIISVREAAIKTLDGKGPAAPPPASAPPPTGAAGTTPAPASAPARR